MTLYPNIFLSSSHAALSSLPSAPFLFPLALSDTVSRFSQMISTYFDFVHEDVVAWNSCSLDIEDTSHYLLHCHHFSQYRIDLMKSVKSILENFESLSDNVKKDMLLYGDSHLDGNKNKFI